MLKYYILYPVRPCCFAWFEMADNPSNFRMICSPHPPIGGCLRKSFTTCSVLIVNVRWISEFVVKICSKVFAKAFSFSWIVAAVFPIMIRGGILGLLFVKHLVMLRVFFMLLMSRTFKVFCQVFDNCSFLAEAIYTLKELMRRRRVRSCVLLHCVRSLFLFWMRIRVEVAICNDLKVHLCNGTA
jgi:hypothetical protein